MTAESLEVSAGIEAPLSILHQALSDSGEPQFEIEIPHEWRNELSTSLRGTCVKTTTLKPSGREVMVKFGTTVSEYEYKVLQFVWSAAAPSAMCPEPIAFFSLPEIQIPPLPPRDPKQKPRKFGHRLAACRFLVMSPAQGVKLQLVPRRQMAKGAWDRVLRDAVARMSELNESLRRQGISNPVPGCFSDIDGRRCLDLPLLKEYVEWPVPETIATDQSTSAPNFRDRKSLKDLNPVRDQVLACITLQDAARFESKSKKVPNFSPTGPQPIRFCHMNITAATVMVAPVEPEATTEGALDDGQKVAPKAKQWRFAGLVDWEYAGWYTARLEAYAGISRSYISCCCTHTIRKGPHGEEHTYEEIEAKQWCADLELVEAAEEGRNIRDERETDPYRLRSVVARPGNKAVPSISPVDD